MLPISLCFHSPIMKPLYTSSACNYMSTAVLRIRVDPKTFSAVVRVCATKFCRMIRRDRACILQGRPYAHSICPMLTASRPRIVTSARHLPKYESSFLSAAGNPLTIIPASLLIHRCSSDSSSYCLSSWLRQSFRAFW